MTGPALARLTSVVVVGAAGLVLGHVLNPWPTAGVRPVPLAAFALAVGAIGAWRGWREGVVRARWDGAAGGGAGGAGAPGAGGRRAALGAAAALLAAALGYAAVHGG